MRNIVKLAIYAALGLYDRAREIVDDLVKRGELMKHEGEEILAEAKTQETARLKGIQERIEATVQKVVDQLPIPATAKDMAALEARVEAIEARILALEAKHKEAESPVGAT
jgi:polyhydroxyalkanoate synthesis regulator phasin